MSGTLGLYVSDEQLCDLLGVGKDKGRIAFQELEIQGFPRKDKLFANKRYFPAVKAFLDDRNGLGRESEPLLTQDGEENWDG